MLSILPAAAVACSLAKSLCGRPFRAAAMGFLAAGAMGGVPALLACGFGDPMHLLRGHLLGPLLIAAAAVYPVGHWLRSLRG